MQAESENKKPKQKLVRRHSTGDHAFLPSKQEQAARKVAIARSQSQRFCGGAETVEKHLKKPLTQVTDAELSTLQSDKKAPDAQRGTMVGQVKASVDQATGKVVECSVFRDLGYGRAFNLKTR